MPDGLSPRSTMPPMGAVDLSTETPIGEEHWVRDRIVPTLMWGREQSGFHSRVHVANYYSLLKPDEHPDATVIVDLINGGGNRVASHEGQLGPEQHLQLEVADLVSTFEGTIAVRLVPKQTLEHNHRYIGTLYFVTWYDEAGHIQFSHEQNRMTFEPAGRPRTYLSPGILVRPELDIAFILQNSYFGAEPMQNDSVEIALVDAGGRELAARQAQLPARTSTVLSLAETFGQLPVMDTIAIRVRGNHLNHPFTFVSHANGDFALHHF